MPAYIYAFLWMAGVVGFIVSAPKNIQPMPGWVGLIVVVGTIWSLFVLAKRFPMFGYFLACVITSLMTKGRVWGAPGYFGRPYYRRRYRRW